MFQSIGKAATTAGTLMGVIGLCVGLFWTWISDSGFDVQIRDKAMEKAEMYCMAPEEQRAKIRGTFFTTPDGEVFLQANCDVFQKGE
jgi:hypothetical protein